ncbi:MAG: hypothetical protein KGI89_15675 [Euryarchaeota archaeon]|nr:hypothetical protein [Euryarchaeota archaeon]
MSAATTLEAGSSVMARQSADTRKIAGFMAFAVVFALVGRLSSVRKVANPIGDAKVIVGGTIGTVLLALLADTGEAAARFAVGVAEVTLLSSVLINGRDVFSGVNRSTGHPAVATGFPSTYPATRVVRPTITKG